jgi:hypothetical protein
MNTISSDPPLTMSVHSDLIRRIPGSKHSSIQTNGLVHFVPCQYFCPLLIIGHSCLRKMAAGLFLSSYTKFLLNQPIVVIRYPPLLFRNSHGVGDTILRFTILSINSLRRDLSDKPCFQLSLDYRDPAGCIRDNYNQYLPPRPCIGEL